MAKLNERETARRDELIGKENKTTEEEQELADLQRREAEAKQNPDGSKRQTDR